jgi:hypothetical protein
MTGLKRFSHRIILHVLAVALAVPALAQAPATPPGAPPGGTVSAWPLGVIVALVGVVALWGALIARRRRRGTGGRAPRTGA